MLLKSCSFALEEKEWEGTGAVVIKRKDVVRLPENENWLYTIFEESPVSFWVVDVSEALAYLGQLRNEGVVDYSSYFDTHPEAVQMCCNKLRVIDVNRATLEMFGLASKKDLLEKVPRLVTQESLEAFKMGLVALAEGETTIELETPTRKLSGELIYNTVKCKQVTCAENIPILLFTLADISKRRQAELALEKSEQRYRTLFENASDIIQILSPEGRLLYVNPTWVKTFGYSRDEVRTMKVFDFIHPDCADVCYANFERVLAQGTLQNVEIAFQAKGGNKVTVEGNVNCQMENDRPQYVQCIFRDVTSSKKMEEELRKAQKLESVGVLAGGIAHDFNNILTSVIGNISLARIYAQPGDKICDRLSEAERVLLRAKDLTQQLLTFSKGGEPVKSLIDVRALLQEASSFVLRGSKARCICELPDDIWTLEADEGQLSQVVHNLVINANQAMPEGGEITITAQNRVLAADNSLTLSAGHYVVVSVADQGIGIKTEHIDRIFDPYFSTKQKGHGLGLATAYSIIKNHGGLMTVDSIQGQGSNFTLYLPALRQVAVQRKKKRESLLRGKGRVLVIDDERDIRQVATEMLKFIGYEATAATNGQEALSIYEHAMRNGSHFDVVIMDLTIPGGMGGRETVEKLLALDPDAKAIVSSGYVNDPIISNYKEYGFVGVIPKPYMIECLSNELQKLTE